MKNLYAYRESDDLEIMSDYILSDESETKDKIASYRIINKTEYNKIISSGLIEDNNEFSFLNVLVYDDNELLEYIKNGYIPSDKIDGAAINVNSMAGYNRYDFEELSIKLRNKNAFKNIIAVLNTKFSTSYPIGFSSCTRQYKIAKNSVLKLFYDEMAIKYSKYLGHVVTYRIDSKLYICYLAVGTSKSSSSNESSKEVYRFIASDGVTSYGKLSGRCYFDSNDNHLIKDINGETKIVGMSENFINSNFSERVKKVFYNVSI